MANTVTLAHASQTLTASGAISNGETVTIGGKVYTFQTTLTDVNGNVALGANAAEALANLKAAINLEAGAGTAYAASMTRNNDVICTAVTATTLTVTAPGAVGNHVPVAETGVNLAWGAATLANGAGNIPFFISELLRLNQVNSEVQQELKKLTAETD